MPKKFTDISKPASKKTRKKTDFDKIEEETPPKTKTTKNKNYSAILIFSIVLIIVFGYLLYANGHFKISEIFKNTISGFSIFKKKGSKNDLGKMYEDLKLRFNESQLPELFKKIPGTFGNITSLGKDTVSIFKTAEYLSENGLNLALSQQGDQIINTLQTLVSNIQKIKKSSPASQNQFSSSSQNSLPELDALLEKSESFLVNLSNWLKKEPEQHLLILFNDNQNKFISDIMIKNANITNILTKNTKQIIGLNQKLPKDFDQTTIEDALKTISLYEKTAFGGVIEIDISLIKEISEIVGSSFEINYFTNLFPKILESIANSNDEIKQSIYTKIGDAFKNQEILIYFPDLEIQPFLDELFK